MAIATERQASVSVASRRSKRRAWAISAAACRVRLEFDDIEEVGYAAFAFTIMVFPFGGDPGGVAVLMRERKPNREISKKDRVDEVRRCGQLA